MISVRVRRIAWEWLISKTKQLKSRFGSYSAKRRLPVDITCASTCLKPWRFDTPRNVFLWRRIGCYLKVVRDMKYPNRDHRPSNYWWIGSLSHVFLGLIFPLIRLFCGLVSWSQVVTPIWCGRCLRLRCLKGKLLRVKWRICVLWIYTHV